jgi:UDP-N-acetylglucosamine acyltransferase
VEVQDDATISAFTSVSPFRRIGRHAYIGGYSVITMDALPFSITVGQKPAWYGLNRIGLERKGYSPTQIEELESALRTLLRSGMNLGDAVASLRSLETKSADVDYLIEFVASSEHGVIKAARRGSRGADASD